MRQPLAHGCEGREVFVRGDPATVDVVRSPRPDSWAALFALDAPTEVPSDFLSEADRNQGTQNRNPFEGL